MKCDETAENFRSDGNLLFRDKKFHEALVAYNQSLCFSTSKDLSLAYANRSAVYLEAKFYKECLENIKLACDHEYPKEKLSKLLERQQKCKKLMKVERKDPENEPWNFFKLSHSPNQKIPFIINCLELRESEKYGRYLITKKDLKTGDVIAIEEPFYKFIGPEMYHSRCSNCLKSNNLNLIPCATCTKTMYCSPRCQAEHHKAIHGAECCKKPLPIVLIVCAKMIFMAMTIAGSFKKLCNLINDTKSVTIFDCDLSDPTAASYKKNLLKVLNSCAMSESSKIVITENMKAMFDHPPFASIWETPKERELLIECFHRQLRIHNTNKLEMGQHTLEISPKERFWYSKTIGGGLCPFASLFNHSCDANVKRFTVDNKLAFVAGQPIKAGEQLFISYGFSSYRISREDRQEELSRFSFTCDCIACVKNYPQLPKLPKFDYGFVEPVFKAESVKKAVVQFRKNCDYIDKNFFQHPSYETTILINHNEHLLHQISKVTFDGD